MRALGWILAATVLAGCATGAPDETPRINDVGANGGDAEPKRPEQASNASTPGPKSPAEPSGPPGPDLLPARILFTDCTGFEAKSHWPSAVHPEQPPEGWGRDALFPSTTSRFHVVECHRITWGPFERGPVSFVIDSTNNIDAPPRCTNAATHVEDLGLQFGFSDEEVQGVLREQLGIAPSNLTVTRVSQPLGEATRHTVTADAPPLGRSEISILAHDDIQGAYRSSIRYFWPTSEGLTMLDLEVTGLRPTIDPRATVGTMGAGTLHGRTYGPIMAGGSVLYNSASIDLHVTKFEDLECSQGR